MSSTHPLVALNTGLLDDTDEDGLSVRYSDIEDITLDEVSPTVKHKQAGLLLRKGRDNEKFTSPVTTRMSEIAYVIVHHPAYLWFNFLTVVALLLLAFGEFPSIRADKKSTSVNEKTAIVLVELLLLFLLGINLLFRLIWLEPKLFVRSRGMIGAIIIAVMVIEDLLILARQERHMRFTRALRPFLLLDTFLMSGVRRVVRQIVLCLKYIFDVMLVLFFLIAIFAITAYFLFATTDPTYFSDVDKSFVSMFITLTTANHPDVFLEAYNRSKVAPLFFMVYMLVTFYYFSNVLLAVVFAKFKEAEKNKYKKLYLHRRKALREVFNILKGVDECGISFGDFLCCIREFQPRIATHEVMCVFKCLKETPEDMNDWDYTLSWNEFSNLYDNIGLTWSLTHHGGFDVAWYDGLKCLKPQVKASMRNIHDAIQHWLFSSIMTFIVLVNLLFLIVSISLIEKDCKDEFGNSGRHEDTDDQFCAIRHEIIVIGSFIFIIIYMSEISVRLFLDGPIRFFRQRWNTVDFVLVFGSFICLVVEVSLINHFKNNSHNYQDMVRYLAIARPLVLLRLLKLKRNYLYLIRIMVVLFERMISVFFLLMIVFYVYAIIGMEVFTGDANSVAYNCCHNAWYDVSEYYQSNSLSNNSADLYWLNNFDDLWKSYVTLYELTVVNNWFIIMEGFVSTTSDFARVYFILFWITTTLVVNTAIVYIVDAFESGILALNVQQPDKDGSPIIKDLKRIVRVKLTSDDIAVMEKTKENGTRDAIMLFSISHLIRKYKTLSCAAIRRRNGEFRGKRIMNNHDLRQIIYNSEVQLWKEEFEQEQSSNEQQSSVNHEKMGCKQLGKIIAKYLWQTTKQVVYYLLG